METANENLLPEERLPSNFCKVIRKMTKKIDFTGGQAYLWRRQLRLPFVAGQGEAITCDEVRIDFTVC